MQSENFATHELGRDVRGGEHAATSGESATTSSESTNLQGDKSQGERNNNHLYARQSNFTFKDSHKVSGSKEEGVVAFPKARLLDRFDLCDNESTCVSRSSSQNPSPVQTISKSLYSTLVEKAQPHSDMCEKGIPPPPAPVGTSPNLTNGTSIISHVEPNFKSPNGVEDAFSPPPTSSSEQEDDNASDLVVAQTDFSSPLLVGTAQILTAHVFSHDDEEENKENGSPPGSMEGTPVKQGTSGKMCYTPHVTVKGDNPDEDPLVAAAKVANQSLSKVVTHPSLSKLTDFRLSKALTLDLTQHCVNRVSFYGIIHDINKEAMDMAKEDHSAFNVLQQNKTKENLPLSVRHQTDAVISNADAALVDEEEWLLSVIASRTEEEVAFTAADQKQSGVTAGTYRVGGVDNFAYACGEKDSKEPPIPSSDDASSSNGPTNEYGDNPNPVVTMNSSSRTQLWKPSRSWWEARSGKNPWIDAKNHVKRWRYLWPLIHYHKFLAKCIKKLKRNGFTDFLDPNAPTVIAFLRYEICAISNHLATCSRFNSEQWLHCLQYFEGWNDTSLEAQSVVREFVARQKLRGFAEARDVQSSPLLRKVMNTVVANSQVDPEAELAAQAISEGVRASSGKQGDRPRSGGRGSNWNLLPGMSYGMPPAFGMPSMPYGQPLYPGYGGPFAPPPGMYPYPPVGPQGRLGWPRQQRRGNSQKQFRGDRSVPPAMYGGGYAMPPPGAYGVSNYYHSGVGMGHPYPSGPTPGFQSYPGYGPPSGQSQAHWQGSMPQVDETAPVVEPQLSGESFNSSPPEPSSTIAATPSKKSSPPRVATEIVPASPAHKTATPIPPTPPARILPSPAHTIPASPYWSNFANQVVDYVCDSPYVPAASTPGTPQHRITPGHQLNDVAARMFYEEQHHYHFGGAPALVPPSPATQFVSTMSPHGSGQATTFFAQMHNMQRCDQELPMSPRAVPEPRTLTLTDDEPTTNEDS